MIDIDPYWEKFIEENVDLIEDNKWEELYSKAQYRGVETVGKLTDLLYDAEIDPLEKATRVPKNFMRNSIETKGVVIPEGVLYVGEHAFESSNIESVFIPKSVIRIEARAFCDCKYLKEVTIEGANTVADATAWVFDNNVHFICNSKNEQIQALAYTFDYPIRTFDPDKEH